MLRYLIQKLIIEQKILLKNVPSLSSIYGNLSPWILTANLKRLHRAGIQESLHGKASALDFKDTAVVHFGHKHVVFNPFMKAPF